MSDESQVDSETKLKEQIAELNLTIQVLRQQRDAISQRCFDYELQLYLFQQKVT